MVAVLLHLDSTRLPYCRILHAQPSWSPIGKVQVTSQPIQGQGSPGVGPKVLVSTDILVLPWYMCMLVCGKHTVPTDLFSLQHLCASRSVHTLFLKSTEGRIEIPEATNLQ